MSGDPISDLHQMATRLRAQAARTRDLASQMTTPDIRAQLEASAVRLEVEAAIVERMADQLTPKN